MDPFEGTSNSFEVTHPVDTIQLQGEIKAQVGQEAQVALSVDHFGHVPSPEQSAVVFVSPKGLDESAIREVIESHVPTVSPEPDSEMAAIDQKLRDGKTLTTAEISTVLRSMMNIAGSTGRD
jgi:hypothetical protein